MDAVSIVAAKGFSANGIAAGIKDGDRDLAVLLSDEPVVTAARFTKNLAAAAPVQLDRERLSSSHLMRGVVVNSGCANAATGATGYANAQTMTEVLAVAAGGQPSEYLACSTGTIGPQLPMEAITAGIAKAVAGTGSHSSTGTAAALAIMTTDSVPKEAVIRADGWVVGGMAKGAGMVRPDMATMLAFLTTDADVSAEALEEALAIAVDGSFNSLNIDGCESTNDTVIAMASGASGTAPDPEVFTEVLTAVCRDLAMQMAADAEGASRVVTIDVGGASSDSEARRLGRIVADSALVRSSFYGGDVNWGRIVGALGSAESDIDFADITVSYGGVVVFESGEGTAFDEQELLDRFVDGDMDLAIGLGTGPGTAHIVTTDLTPEYVAFNGERS